MRKHILPTLVTLLLFTACAHKTIMEDTHTFPNQRWMRFEPETFLFDIKDNSDCYNIFLTLRIDTLQYPYAELPLIVDMYNDNEEHRMFTLTARLHDKDGRPNGNTSGHYVEVRLPVREYFFFNTDGPQRMEVKQATSKYELNGISSLHVQISKADLRLRNKKE